MIEKLWILTGLVTILLGIVGFSIKLIISYIKKELSILNNTVSNHNTELTKNIEQLKSLFKSINNLMLDNTDFNKRINKLEIDQNAIGERCKIYHSA